MYDENGSYNLKKEWVEIATQKNVLAMANAMYADLKKYFYNGEFIPTEDIKDLVDTVKVVLQSDFDWSEEEVTELEKKFYDFNKYYPKTIQEAATLPPALQNILQQIQGSGVMAIPLIPQDGSPPPINHIHMEFVRKDKKPSRWEMIKRFTKGIFKFVVYWLALLGLLTLLGM